MNALEQLKEMTTVVADTGDINAIARYKPQDATTNPSLILKAVNDPRYAHLVDEAVSFGKQYSQGYEGKLALALSRVSVNFGVEILKTIPGRVSTEVDARVSFDPDGTISYARNLILLYENAEIHRDKVLVKIASTWEGIQAARMLEQDGIHCNLTLSFGLVQGIASAQAGATLISPFVGRITDWYKKELKKGGFPVDEDPGVLAVRRLYHSLKEHGYSTEIMGASFRSPEQVLALAGCDLLTISPELLQELEKLDGYVDRVLSLPDAAAESKANVKVTENMFRWMLNEDKAATELLADGIRRFAADTIKLEEMIKRKLAE